MSAAYQNLQQVFTRVHHLDHAMTFLNWDQMVMMPPRGLEQRSNAIAELATMSHDLLCGPRMEEWFGNADGTLNSEWEKASLREMHRRWQQSVCLPSALVSAKILAGARCEHAWRQQREANDWVRFLGNFKEVVSLAREEARLRQAAGGDRFIVPYDALLDLHCAGDDSALITSVFATLKAGLPDLLNQIMEQQKLEATKPVDGQYPLDQQNALNQKLMCALGFDFDAGRLDVSLHPFSTGGRGDQRITTRFRENDFADALLATAHETGHASYEGGLPERWDALPVGASRNMCIHESQSLLFEKQIFLSHSFCEFFTSTVHQLLPETRRYNATDIWRSCTRVQPSFIRVKADEVTYPLHVMLRYDIESALINGELEPESIPEIWDQKMKDYLGLEVAGEHSRGCLQDIHWTDGAFGYFPSYTMGAVNGAQLFATIKQQHPDWQDRFRVGEIGFVREWLETNIWSLACSLESQELMQQATGEGSNPEHLLSHLAARYLRQEY